MVAAVEGVDAFAIGLKSEADRLGVTSSGDATVLGDGASWIWNLAEDVLPRAEGVPDVYRAAERIATVARAVWREGTARAVACPEEGRSAPIAEGSSGLESWIARVFEEVGTGLGYDAPISLGAYATSHTTRPNYAGRLRFNRRLTSGPIVNLRLKRTGARWGAENVGPFLELVAPADSAEWQSLWTALRMSCPNRKAHPPATSDQSGIGKNENLFFWRIDGFCGLTSVEQLPTIAEHSENCPSAIF